MDLSSYTIGESDKGWFIHAFMEAGGAGRWLSKVEDKWINSIGANSRQWDGYYATKQEAENRFKGYKMKTTKQICIGGE